MARLLPTKSVERNCLRILPRLVRRYFKLGRSLTLQTSNQDMHQFRIRTKRLRYITELYANLYPRPLRASLDQFRRIQGILGGLQDQTMVIGYFEQRLMHVRTPERQTEYLRVLHRARVRQAGMREVFFQHWAELEREGFEKWLLNGIERAISPKKE